MGADSSRVFWPVEATNFFVFVIVDNQNGVQVFVGRPEKPVSGTEILDRDENVGCTEPGTIFHKYFGHCEGLRVWKEGTIEQNLPHQEICQKSKKIRYHCWRIGVGMGRVEVDTSFSQHLS